MEIFDSVDQHRKYFASCVEANNEFLERAKIQEMMQQGEVLHLTHKNLYYFIHYQQECNERMWALLAQLVERQNGLLQTQQEILAQLKRTQQHQTQKGVDWIFETPQESQEPSSAGDLSKAFQRVLIEKGVPHFEPKKETSRHDDDTIFMPTQTVGPDDQHTNE